MAAPPTPPPTRAQSPELKTKTLYFASFTYVNPSTGERTSEMPVDTLTCIEKRKRNRLRRMLNTYNKVAEDYLHSDLKSPPSLNVCTRILRQVKAIMTLMENLLISTEYPMCGQHTELFKYMLACFMKTYDGCLELEEDYMQNDVVESLNEFTAKSV